jgi:hypothetical protein
MPFQGDTGAGDKTDQQNLEADAYIDLFLQNTMKESILNIQLAKRPATSNS